MRKKIISFIIAVTITLTMVPQVAYARLNAYEWNLMQKLSEAEASNDTNTMVSVLLELISIEEKYNDEDAHLRLAPYYQKLGRYYDSIGEYEKARECFFREAYHRQATGNYDSALTDLARARQIKIEVQVFREVPVGSGSTLPSEAGKPLAINEPLFGTYLGGHFPLDPNVGLNYSLASLYYGKPHAILEYVNWGNPVPNGTLEKVRQLGVPLELALQPVPDLTVVKDGSYIRGLLAQLKSLGVPVFLRFGGEMNGSWTSWGKKPELFKEKFRLLADIVHKEAPNVAMVWCPNHTPEDYEDYYPGDEYVDWVGVNFYSDYYMSGDKTIPLTSQMLYQAGKTASPIDKLIKIYEMYADRKPIMIGECGVSHYSITTKEDCTDWGLSELSQIYGYIPLKFPRIKAIFYFSVNQGDPGYKPSNRWSDYSLAQPEFKERYVQLTQSPWYLSGKETSSPVRYAPIEEVGLTPGENKLYAYVRLPYPFVGKVQYELDGKVVGVSSLIPFETRLVIPESAQNQEGASDGISVMTPGTTHILTVRTWYQEGKEGPSKSYAIDGETLRAVPISGQELPEPQFTDISNHWASADVERLAGLGILKGYGDNTFRPDATITRAEFLKVLFGVVGINSDPPEVGPNSDEAFPYGRGHWAQTLIDAGRSLGIIQDSSGKDIAGVFNPDEPCPRWEMAVYAVRALGLDKASTTSSGYSASENQGSYLQAGVSGDNNTGFVDNDQIPAQWRETIKIAVENGLIKGLDGGRFGPWEPMTRAQACVMAIRIMRYLGDR